ncbi:hypothetical protein [Streptomyces canus]|uniref:hypothetical protein n=1 Tax=Streptomyces canus TaxID=58343 RepID=UPI000366C040|nr:hypothetical protein [Streptomyces canus]
MEDWRRTDPQTACDGTEPEYVDSKGCRTELNVWSRKDGDDADAAVHFDDLWGLAEKPPWRCTCPR